jgi:hypothetical protein
MRTEGTTRIAATVIGVVAIAVCLVLTEARPFGITAKVSGAQPAIAVGSNGVKPVVFTDVTSAAKITWSHDNLATPEKYLIETMGGGGAFLDYDQDGLMDIYLVNSGPTPYHKPKSPIRNALYRNNGDGTFTDVTLKAGVAGGGFGQGVAVGDFNNDGFPDIYVTNFGKNILYLNNGDGTFTDVTAKAGVAAGGWSTSAAFLDYDNDGYLDLFVCRYLDWDYSKNIFCGENRPGYRSYCHPNNFKGVSSILYHNNHDGTFTDVSKKAGIEAAEGKALGVVCADFNNDGRTDIFVANDAVRNFLFLNNGDGTFTENGLLAGVAYGLSGRPKSGMGCDFGDIDGDGMLDLFVTNIDLETNTVFFNNGDATFTDVTARVGLGQVSMLFSGFGAKLVDYDDDGDLDLIIANGHPLDNVHLFRDGVTWAERPFVHDNVGGRFVDVSDQRGEAMKKKYSARGLAVGDYDNDGDSDFLLVQNGGPPVLLRNDGGNQNNWVGLRLVGTKSNRDAVGARVTLTAGDLKVTRQIEGGSSYCSAHDPRMLIGLGQRRKVDQIEIRWPSGVVDTVKDLPINRYAVVKESVGAKK